VVPLHDVEATTVLVQVESVRPGQSLVVIHLQLADIGDVLVVQSDDPVVALVRHQEAPALAVHRQGSRVLQLHFVHAAAAAANLQFTFLYIIERNV